MSAAVIVNDVPPPLPKPGMVGPLVGFDVIRLARSKRSFVIRFLYAAFLLVVTGVYFFRIGSWLEGLGAISPGNLAVVAEQYVNQFFVWQSIALLLFTPAYLGGAVTEERERGTLDL